MTNIRVNTGSLQGGTNQSSGDEWQRDAVCCKVDLAWVAHVVKEVVDGPLVCSIMSSSQYSVPPTF